MARRTLVALVVLVLVLAVLWRQKQRADEGGGPTLEDYPLCPGFSAERVALVSVDHLERNYQLRLERDAGGRWFMTDPLAYPAEGSLVRAFLRMLETARAEPAPEVARAAVGLDPPRVVIECRSEGPDGERTVRVELGAVDFDPALVHARVSGHPAAEGGGYEIFRTGRALSTTLERMPDDYRDRRTTALRAEDVVSIRRRGLVYREEGKALVGIDFDAALGSDGWKRLRLPVVSLEPSAMGLLARGATELRVERFVDDSPSGLAPYGLDPPAFTLEIEALGESPVLLSFGGPGNREQPIGTLPWFCVRGGYPHVWEVSARDVELLTQPDTLFFDQLLVRGVRADVARLELEGEGARRILVRDKQGWQVHEERGGSASAAHPGSAEAIDEALGLLERSQLAEHLEREPFEASEPPLGFALQLEDGTRMGGAIGRTTRDPASGAVGHQYLRLGDEVVALVGDDVAELCARSLDRFRSRRMHQIPESTVRTIELEHAGRTFAFVNDGNNVWMVRAKTIPAPTPFQQALDGLLNLAVLRWLDAAPEGETVLAVRIVPVQGEPRALDFARLADGTTVCSDGTGQTAEVDGALVERLLGLF